MGDVESRFCTLVNSNYKVLAYIVVDTNSSDAVIDNIEVHP